MKIQIKMLRLLKILILKIIDFSEKYSDEDLAQTFLINNNNNSVTPFKPDEINKEIYPNEHFMGASDFYNIHTQSINQDKVERMINNELENNIEDLRNKSSFSVNNVLYNKGSNISLIEIKSKNKGNIVLNDNNSNLTNNLNTNINTNVNTNTNNIQMIIQILIQI